LVLERTPHWMIARCCNLRTIFKRDTNQVSGIPRACFKTVLSKYIHKLGV
jgi:hypothetical protein